MRALLCARDSVRGIRAHFHAQCLDLIGSRHRAAVIVGEHHYGAIFQAGIENPLATHVKVVHIDQRE